MFRPHFGIDEVRDFHAGSARGHDFIEFDRSMFADFMALASAMSQVGGDVVIHYGANTRAQCVADETRAPGLPVFSEIRQNPPVRSPR